MKLFYNKNLSNDDSRFTINKQESKHIIRVLRKRVGDIIYITNGKGIIFTSIIELINKNNTELKIINIEKVPKSKFHVNIALAPTKMNDRTEWFVEKSTEIGINVISTILCENSERKKIKIDRLEKISVSAMKQSLQLNKPVIEDLVTFEKFIVNCKSKDKFIAHCNESKKLYLGDCVLNSKTATVLIGPEGGFTEYEIRLAEDHGFISVSLGKTRLRTETAAMVSTQLLSVYNLDN